MSLLGLVTAIYSASVVDKATHFCNLDCDDINPLAKVNRKANVDFLPSRSASMSAYVKSSRIG